MVYNWGDLDEFRERPIEVEWGANLHPTRRVRTLERHHRQEQEKRNRCISNAVVILSLIVAVTMVAFMSMTLMKAPPIREVDASKAVGSTPQIPSPTMKPSMYPSSSPTVESSEPPSKAASSQPSAHPSRLATPFPTSFLKAPPAPEALLCIDQEGFFYNHAADKVSCDWFQGVGTYNYERNCKQPQTDLGKACVFSCRNYNNCVMPTNVPSDVPSASPTSLSPTSNPTPKPPRIMTIYPSGDAMIKEETPLANYGRASYLKIDTDSGVFHSLLRFDISAHNSNRTVESATLRLKAVSDCPSGGYLQRTHHPHWDEMTITWDSAPEGDGHEVARFLEPIKNGFWYSVDISKGIRPGHSTLSLRLFPVSSDECIFASKENGSGESPELRIVYEE